MTTFPPGVVPALFARVINEHGAARLRASGSSMLPSVRPGDILLIRRCTPEHVVAGQIVLARRDDRLIAHRVARVRDTTHGSLVTTRGDAHWRCDPEVPQSQLIGRVEAIERDGRVRNAPIVTPFHRIVGVALNESLAVLRRLRSIARRVAVAR